MTDTPRHGIRHQINAASFTLVADGSLGIDETRTPDGEFLSVEMRSEDVFALATFFRMPGVQALIEACEADRQLAHHFDYEESQGRDAAMVAARDKQR